MAGAAGTFSDRLRKGTGCLLMLVAFGLGFVAYFVRSIDTATGQLSDGWGRPLTESPWLARYFLGQENVWPGLGWLVADMVIWWGLLLLGFHLAQGRD